MTVCRIAQLIPAHPGWSALVDAAGDRRRLPVLCWGLRIDNANYGLATITGHVVDPGTCQIVNAADLPGFVGFAAPELEFKLIHDPNVYDARPPDDRYCEDTWLHGA